MTRFIVVWDAELEVFYIEACLFSDSTSRAILSGVANYLDRELRIDAEINGQPVSESSHRSIDLVLTSTTAHVSAIYEVNIEDRLVQVKRLVFRRA